MGDTAAKKCGGRLQRAAPWSGRSGGAKTPAANAGAFAGAPPRRRSAPPTNFAAPRKPTASGSSSKVRAHKLEMKVSDAEWQWDRKKLTVFFTAEQRVDFRALVRELAVRSAPGSTCGRSVSATRRRGSAASGGAAGSTAAPPGSPSSPRSACRWPRTSSLSLNPAQISGGCGRLLCCLKYEHEFYVTARKRFPREGKTARDAAAAPRR